MGGNMKASQKSHGNKEMANSAIVSKISELRYLNKNRIALQISGNDGIESVTYEELDEQIKHATAILKLRQIKEGATVIILCDARPLAIIAFLTLLEAGAIPVMLDPRLPEHELHEQCKRYDAQYVFTTRERYQGFKSGWPKSSYLCCIDSSSSLSHSLTQLPTFDSSRSVTQLKHSMIFLTSGTTGHLKGVVLSEQAILSSVAGAARKFEGYLDRAMQILPIHHIYPLVTLLCFLLYGKPVGFIKKIDAHEIMAGFKDFKPTTVVVVPQLLELLTSKFKAGLDNARNHGITQYLPDTILRSLFSYKIRKLLGGELKCFVSGGSALRAGIKPFFAKLGIKVVQGYGLTEIAGPAVAQSPDQHLQENVGLPAGDTEIKIINSDNTGQGEICLKGSALMSEYYCDEESTRSVIQDGWLQTGDLGYVDKDGCLNVTGRIKEVIVTSGGEKAFPNQVEEHYCNVKNIKEYAVIGLHIDDKKYDRVVMAVVPSEFDEEIQRQISKDVRDIGSDLPESHKVDSVYYVKDIPRTTTMKVKRFELMETIKQKISSQDREIKLPRTETEMKLVKIWQRILQVEPISIDDNFFELGGTSLFVSELLFNVENEFGKNISSEMFLKSSNLKEFAEIIDQYHITEENSSTHSGNTTANYNKVTDKCSIKGHGFFSDERMSNDQFFAEPILEGPVSPHMMFQGKPVLVWSINDYLGLVNNAEIKSAAAKVVEEYGIGYPMGSRLLSGNTEQHSKLEKSFANLLGTEDALLCNFGYQGAIGNIAALIGEDDYVVIDSEAHSCIVDGARLSTATNPVRCQAFKHNDMNHLESILAQICKRRKGGILIVTDGVYGMTGELVPLDQVVQLKTQYEATLMVDDAHGIGLMGKNGLGTGEHFGVHDQIDIYFATFAKVFGCFGGVTASSSDVIQYLKWNSRANIFSKSLPLVAVVTAQNVLNIMVNHPERRETLWQRARQLQQGLKAAGYDIGQPQSPITPVYLRSGDIKQAKQFIRDLREQYGIFVSGVTYPVVAKGVFLIRLIPTAEHSEEDVSRTIDAFTKLRDRYI